MLWRSRDNDVSRITAILIDHPFRLTFNKVRDRRVALLETVLSRGEKFMYTKKMYCLIYDDALHYFTYSRD